MIQNVLNSGKIIRFLGFGEKNSTRFREYFRHDLKRKEKTIQIQ